MMEAVGSFADVLAWPKLRVLNFSDVPRTVRSKMLDMLPRLTGLHSLTIGPDNTGGWIPLRVSSSGVLGRGL